MAAALSPDGRTMAIDLLGTLWTMPGAGRRGDGHHRHLPRRAAAVVVARRQTDRVSGVSRQHLADLDRQRRRPGTEAGDVESVRRPRTGVVARRQPPRVFVRPRRQLRHLGADARDRRRPPDSRPPRPTSSCRRGAAPRKSPTCRIGATSPASTPRRRRRQARPRRSSRLPTARSRRPAFGPDGAVAFNAIAGSHSRLMIGDRNVADPDEDVFPFRPQWLPTGDVLYTADGKIKRRPAAGGAARDDRIQRGRVVHASRVHAQSAIASISRGRSRSGASCIPAVSPDGRQIAFAALGDLWLMPVDGSPRRLTSDPALDTAPAWSPDGKSLAYASDRSGTMNIWIRDVAERRRTADHAADEGRDVSGVVARRRAHRVRRCGRAAAGRRRREAARCGRSTIT